MTLGYPNTSTARQHVKFGKKCFVEHQPDEKEPWTVAMIHELDKSWNFFHQDDAEKLFEILEEPGIGDCANTK